MPVIVIPGNHDSATRLGVGSDLFRDGVHVVTELTEVGTPIELQDANGPVLVYPIPFLDPDIARHELSEGGGPLERSHEAVMTAAMNRVRDDLAIRRASASPQRTGYCGIRKRDCRLAAFAHPAPARLDFGCDTRALHAELAQRKPIACIGCIAGND